MAFATSIAELIERNGNGLLGKHPSWERVRLGDVVTVQNGAAFKSEHFNLEQRGMPLLRIRDVVRGSTETWYDGPYEDEDVVHPGDLVIGMDGDFNHALWAGPPALLNQRVCRLRFDGEGLTKEWVLQVLGGYLQAVNEATPSVTVKHLSSKTVAGLLLPLPPRPVQDRIVRQLDRSLSEIGNGAEDFRRALTGLGQYRNACLAAAFGGATCRLEDLALIQSGIAKGRPRGDDLVEMPYIRTANVQALRLELDVVKTLHVTTQQHDKHRLQEDDVLVLEGGDADKVGRGWLWSGEVEDCLHQNHVFAVRPDQGLLLPRFLAYYVNAPQARRYFLSVAKQTTNLASINKSNLKDLPVPVPTLEEQRDRVATLDQQLSATAMMEAGLRAGLEDVAMLKRSLLHAAIEGRLASQDEKDDSVEQMLQQARKQHSRQLADSKPMRKKPRAVLIGE
jgi:type I restriction enzyme S subunit